MISWEISKTTPLHGTETFARSMIQPTELSPLDVIALEASLDPFCPQANGGHYRPEDCLPWCTVCRDLMIRKGREP